MVKKKWHELSSAERSAICAGATLQIALAASAWADLARRPATQVRGSKKWWAVAIAVNFLGPVAYFTRGRIHEHTQ